MMNVLLDQIKQLFDSVVWFEFISDLSIKGTIILTLAFFAVFIWKKSSSAIKHSILYLAIICILTIPLFSYIFPTWELPILNSVLPQKIILTSSENEPQNKISKAQGTDLNSTDTTSQSNSQKEDSKQSVISRVQIYVNQLHWSKWLQIFWFAGVLFVLTRLFSGLWGARKTVKNSTQINDTNLNLILKRCQKKLKIEKSIILRESSSAKVPMTIGWFRSIIIFPSDALSWSEKRKEIILLHELAHIKRKDVLATLIAHLSSVFYWFNPLIWISLRQLYIERERASDDLVLSNGTKASDYAHHLLEIAKKVNVKKWASPIGVAMAQKYKLEDRLMSILNNQKQRNTLKPSTTLLIILLAFSILIPLASVQTWAQKDKTQKEKVKNVEPQKTDVRHEYFYKNRIEIKEAQKKKQKEYQTITVKYDKDSNFVYLVYDDEKPKKLDLYRSKYDSLDKWSLYEDEEGHLVLKFKKDNKDSAGYFIVTKQDKGAFTITADSTKKRKIIKIKPVKKIKKQNESNSQDEEKIKYILYEFYKNIESMDFISAMKYLSERGDIKKKIEEKLPQEKNSARSWSIGAASKIAGDKKIFRLEVSVNKRNGSEKVEQKLYYGKFLLKKINIDSEILDIHKTEKGCTVKEKLNLTAEGADGVEHKIFDNLIHNYTFLQKNDTWKIKGKNLFSSIYIKTK